MRKSCLLILVGTCLSGPGCSFFGNIHRNLSHELAHTYTEKVIRKRARQLALQAWEAMVGQYGQCFSEDYEDGFVDGFVDYLVYGGCGGSCGESPIIPAVPPARYTNARYLSPQGYAAIEEWYTGFRHGSATALASGLRNLVVVPVFDPPALNQADRVQPASTTGTADGTLPAPRPLETGGASVIPGGSATPASPNPTPVLPGGLPGPGPGAPNPGGAPGAPPLGPPPGGRPAAPPPGGTPGVPRRPGEE